MIALSIAIYLCCIMTSPALAGMVGTVASDLDEGKARAEELTRIQRFLETQIVKEKLRAYGLTPDEINQRMEGLSDEQVHMLAQASDRILAGGDAGEAIVAVLLIILIIILIVYLMDKRIVIK
jgi:hypothetical protein